MNGDNSDEGGRNRNWTEDLDCCQQTGCGYSINQIYLTDGRIKEGHVDFEKKLYCSYDSDKYFSNLNYQPFGLKCPLLAAFYIQSVLVSMVVQLLILL